MTFHLWSTSLRTKLWVCASLLVILLGTLVIGSFARPEKLPVKEPASINGFGLDFIAFYRAGVLVHSGNSRLLYDLKDTRQFDGELAKAQNLDLGNSYGAFLNPPFFAWLFVPLVPMGYWKAMTAWLMINFCCFGIAAYLLCRIIPPQYDPDPNEEPKQHWRDLALVPVLMLLSYPFIETVCHAQNTCISLLLMSWAVLAWRSGRAYYAGVAIGILFYKPQLAAVVLLAMTLTIGWRALAGACASIAVLLLFNLLTLPGTLTEYFHVLTPNIEYYLATHPNVWMAHATFNGFWHVALGPTSTTAQILAILCGMPVAFGLLLCVWRNRKSGRRDRMISAVIAATPLIMPYYLDYDLLLLSIPAVLMAVEIIDRGPAKTLPKRDTWLIRLWIVLFALLMVNPMLTRLLQVNLAVPLLTSIAGLMIARALEAAKWPAAEAGTIDVLNSSFQWPMAAS
jgi:alpha-1,2-mannosyltransferase